MKYLPIKGKTVVISVDNSRQFVLLALLAFMGEQAECELQSHKTQQEELPVIAF